jgi:hypothetical protein
LLRQQEVLVVVVVQQVLEAIFIYQLQVFILRDMQEVMETLRHLIVVEEEVVLALSEMLV